MRDISGRAGVRILRAVLAAIMALSGSALLAQNAALEPDSAPESTATSDSLTLSARYRWAARSSVSAPKLAGFAISSGISTLGNHPEEYGSHWDGFGKRLGMRLASSATGTMMEASLGALWDEDPRYVRAAGQPIKQRLAHVVKMTFLARDRNGDLMPAYARYISVPANSYMTNAWRADSEANGRHAALRIPMAFLSRAIGNTFTEFWPDATKWLHRD
jgi:hypothetical protein